MPTAGIVARGIAAEGIGVVLAGLFGTGCGTTSYAENIGAISITGVGSRAVVQCGAITMMLLSIFAKFGKVTCSSLYPNVVHTQLVCSSSSVSLPRCFTRNYATCNGFGPLLHCLCNDCFSRAVKSQAYQPGQPEEPFHPGL